MGILNLNNFKRPHIISIIIILLAALAVGGFLRLKFAERERERLEQETKQLELVKAKCLEEVSQMTEERIIEKIKTFTAVTEEIRSLHWSILKHLHCRFLENPFEEQFEKTKALVESLNLSDENERRFLYGLAQHLRGAQENRESTQQRILEPSFPLIVYPKEKICPDGKEDPELVEKLLQKAATKGYDVGTLEKAKSIIGNYCAQINKYLEDESSLMKEIYEFKDWASDPLERRFEYRWKIILASRFGSKLKVLEICDNLINIAEKEDCQKMVHSINDWLISAIKENGCTGYELREVRSLICQFQD